MFPSTSIFLAVDIELLNAALFGSDILEPIAYESAEDILEFFFFRLSE
jgi:hypothetical protein